jgi:DNA-binding MarR family transcriptional regulator
VKPVTVRCPHCRGSGRVALTGEYLTTFLRLVKVGETTGAELGPLMGIKPTAMNNRLARLEKHGLATSRRWGRKRLFRAKPAGAAP